MKFFLKTVSLPLAYIYVDERIAYSPFNFVIENLPCRFSPKSLRSFFSYLCVGLTVQADGCNGKMLKCRRFFVFSDPKKVKYEK